MTTSRPVTARAWITEADLELARDCLKRGGTLMEASLLVNFGCGELDRALWSAIGGFQRQRWAT